MALIHLIRMTGELRYLYDSVAALDLRYGIPVSVMALHMMQLESRTGKLLHYLMKLHADLIHFLHEIFNS